MMSFGVPEGTTMLYQDVTSNPGKPDSASVGRSGAAAMRFELATPSATSLPALTCGNADGVPANIICTCPPTTAPTAGAMPLNGTCTMSIPAVLLKSSPARCAPLPLPGDE